MLNATFRTLSAHVERGSWTGWHGMVRFSTPSGDRESQSSLEGFRSRICALSWLKCEQGVRWRLSGALVNRSHSRVLPSWIGSSFGRESMPVCHSVCPGNS